MFFFFTAKPYTMQMKLETMMEIQEAKDESEAGSLAIQGFIIVGHRYGYVHEPPA